MSLDLLDSAASGMDAQRAALDVAARNVAAAEAAGPSAEYARLIPDFRVVEDDDGEAMVRFSGTHQERGTNVDILTEMIAVMNALKPLGVRELDMPATSERVWRSIQQAER